MNDASSAPSAIKPFFFVGNKRSGTSLLVRLLNLHPHIFVSHESDIVWILYQYHNGMAITRYPEDGALGMNYTLQHFAHLLSPDKTPYDNYLGVQLELMRHGSDWLPPMAKQGLSWVGDKKPVQQNNPEVLAFIARHFPDTRYLHLVRNPFHFLNSFRKMNPGRDDFTDEWILNFWARNEQSVIEQKDKLPILTIGYKELCLETEASLGRILAHLDMDPDLSFLARAEQIRWSHYEEPPPQGVPAGVEAILAHYPNAL